MKSTDKIARMIDYGDVFFIYACQKMELTEKIRQLYIALQNGFTDLTWLHYKRIYLSSFHEPAT
jgi:hypothetical protein